MANSLGQYNHIQGDSNEKFITPIGSSAVVSPIRYSVSADVNVTSDVDSSTIQFWNEGLFFQNKFDLNKTYYFHGKIKRLLSTQNFNVVLIDKDADDSDAQKQQFIKTLVVQSGTGWVDFEFLFTPLDSGFNTVLFDLQRTAEDLSVVTEKYLDSDGNQLYEKKQLGTRCPMLIYEDLGVVNNILGDGGLISQNNLIKIGVQSHPSLMMCINHEEIRTGRSGVYELRNGEVVINFFSVINGSSFNRTSINENVNYSVQPKSEEMDDSKADFPLCDTEEISSEEGEKKEYIYKVGVGKSEFRLPTEEDRNNGYTDPLFDLKRSMEARYEYFKNNDKKLSGTNMYSLFSESLIGPNSGVRSHKIDGFTVDYMYAE